MQSLPSVCAGHWELETAGAEFLEPGSKRAEPPDGLEPVYPQRCAFHFMLTNSLAFTNPPTAG